MWLCVRSSAHRTTTDEIFSAELASSSSSSSSSSPYGCGTHCLLPSPYALLPASLFLRAPLLCRRRRRPQDLLALVSLVFQRARFLLCCSP